MAKKSNLQINVEYAVFRTVFFVIGLLPRKLAVGFCIGLVKLAAKAIPRLRSVGMKNLSIAYPELSIKEHKRILSGTYESLGRVIGELSQFHKYTPDTLSEIIDFKLDEESEALYHRVKSEKRGVVLATGHFGNWEILVLVFAALHEPISYLARPLDNPKIEAALSELRMRFGNTPINKTNSAMTAVSVLKTTFGLGILADVNAHPREGVFVPFFGKLACTPAGAATIAIRANAYIYPVACVWDRQNSRYKFIHGKLLETAKTGDRKRDIVETTAAFTAELESLIRQYPEQWMWTHKRWKTRPPGEEPIY